jgi:hypothetical protein
MFTGSKNVSGKICITPDKYFGPFLRTHCHFNIKWTFQISLVEKITNTVSNLKFKPHRRKFL